MPDRIRWWGWREEIFSLKSGLLCRIGWHNVGCRGKRAPHPGPGDYREHRDRFTEWPPPPMEARAVSEPTPGRAQVDEADVVRHMDHAWWFGFGTGVLTATVVALSVWAVSS